MTSSISSALNSRLRLSGMSSGLDTDTMVKQLLATERAKVDKVKQDKQLLEWKKDNYREMTNLLRGFKDEFFDVLKPASNMRSANNYKAYSVVSTDSNYVTATASGDAAITAHTIKISNVATVAALKSSGTVSNPMEGATVENLPTGKKLLINLDGVSKTITVGDTVEQLQSSIDSAFGAGKIKVQDLDAGSGFKLSFATEGGATKLSLYDSDSGTLSAMGFNAGINTSNRLNIWDTLSSLSTTLGFTLSDGKVNLNINGKDFSFGSSTTLASMMQQINSSVEANVSMHYDEVLDKLVITAKQTGAGNNITIAESGSTFLAKAKLDDTNVEPGVDATIILDEQTLKRSSNTFTVSGVTYTALKETTAEQKITVSQDVDSVYNKIKTFVDKYNELISKINSEISEKYDRNYLPLTDDQKDSMSEDDIKKWEEKAKTGLLRNDIILSNITSKMRLALYDSIKDVQGGLSTIGITTSTYLEKGKLIIDETKLKEAIRNQPDKVMTIFSKESSVSYKDTFSNEENKTKRYNENGIINRIYDILQDNIRTTRDKDGKKGLLLEKAGTTDDITEFDNMLQDEIDEKEDKIDELLEKLYDKEDKYYAKFAAMEKAMQQMNAQSSWLTQQLGGGQQ